MSLSGRVALITGASQGIGRTCALVSPKKARPWPSPPQQEKLNELVTRSLPLGDSRRLRSRCGRRGAGQVHGESRHRAVRKIDILVNNAGITRDQLVMRMKRADWDAVLQTNLTSAYLCIQQVIPSMLKQRWGRIINITSVFGQMGQAGQANYSASKAGLIGLTMAIAREVGSRNITCNADRSRIHRNCHDRSSQRRIQADRGQTDSAGPRRNAGQMSPAPSRSWPPTMRLTLPAMS